ncbi:MAG: ATP-binding cassette domain-containing protein, partial [Pseudothermotoga sp.]
MNTPLVQMKGIKKSFGRVQALKGVDFEVGRNEIVGLLGDNGAGKSTLIKILVGYYRPDEGEIYFEGNSVNFKSPWESRQLGIETVYQDLALVNLMPLWRNFFLGREIVKKI